MPAPPWLPLWLRRLLLVPLVLAGAIVLAFALLQTSPVATWLGRRLAHYAPLNPGYNLAVGRVSGNWLTGLQLEDVRLRRQGRDLARVAHLRVTYDLGALRPPNTRLQELALDGVAAVARREGDGWDLARALKESTDTASRSGFSVDRLELDHAALTVVLAPDSTWEVRDLFVRAHRLATGAVATGTLDTLGARLAPPGRPPLWVVLGARGAATPDAWRLDPFGLATAHSRLAGRLVLPRRWDRSESVDRLALALEGRPLDLADVARVAPSVAPGGAITVHLAVTTRNRVATGELRASLGDATLEARGSAAVGRGGPRAYRAHLVSRGLDPARLVRAAPAGRLDAELDLALAGPSLRHSNGRINLSAGGSRMGARVLDRLEVVADVHGGRGDVELRAAAGPATLAASGWVRPLDSIPTYRLAGILHRPPGTDTLVRRLVGPRGDPTLAVRFRGRGAGFRPRTARLAGRADLEAERSVGGAEPLGHATIALQHGRLTADAELPVAGGRVTGLATATFGDEVSYAVRRGIIDRVDLGRILGDTLAGLLSGRFTLNGRGTSASGADVTARVELDTLRYGARRVDGVVIRAGLEHGRARINATGALQGGRLTVEAAGRPLDSMPTIVLRQVALDSVDLGTLGGRPALAGPVTLRAHGELRGLGPGRTMRGHLELSPSRFGRYQATGGTVDARLRGSGLVYDVRVRTTAGAVALAGAARLADGGSLWSVRRGRADSLDLGRLLGRPGLVTDLNLRFSGAVRGTSPARMLARLDLDLLPSRVNSAALGSGHATVTLEHGRMRAGLVAESPDGSLAASATGLVGGSRPAVRAEGTVRVERLARWTGRSDADGRLEGRFALDGVADSAGLLTLGGTVNLAGGVGRIRLDQLYLALRPLPGVLAVDTAVVRSNVLALDGRGRVALRSGAGAPADTLRFTGVSRDLAPLAGLAGRDSISLDSGRVALRVAGPARQWQLDGSLEAYRLLYAGRQAQQVGLSGRATVRGSRVAGVAGELRVEGGSLGRVSFQRLTLAGRYDSVVTLQGSLAFRDSVRVTTALRGAARGDTLDATLERLDIQEGGRRWALAHPAAIVLRPRVEVHDLTLVGPGHRLHLDGTYAPKDSSDVAMEVRGLELDTFHELGLAPVGGRLDGLMRLTGRAAAPTLTARMDLAVHRPGGRDLGRVGARLAWTAAGLRLDAAALPAGGGRFTATGTLPYRLTLAPRDTAATVGIEAGPTDTLGLVVRADSFDLGLFDPLLPEETARSLGGGLRLDAAINGTMKAPRAVGTVRLTGVKVTLPVLGVSYQRGVLVGALSGDRLRIDTLRLRTAKHEVLEGRGAILLAPLTDPGLQLDADLRDFQVSNSATLRTRASGQLQLAGTLSEPSLTGGLTLGRTDLYQGAEAGASTRVEQVELSEEDRRELARNFGPAALRHADDGPGLVGRFRLDLDVRMPGDVWFRRRISPKIDIELNGRVRMTQEPGQPMEFHGRAEPTPGRGFLELYGRNFRLTGGAIVLGGPADSTRLDVTAEYQVPTQSGPDAGVLIDVAAKGRPDSLSLAFSSDPSLDQEDIVSYLVTGRPASENPLAGQTAGEAGAELAFNRISEQLSGAAGEKLGLDVFQIRQDGLRGLTLTAGRYVAPRVFLSIEQPIQLSSDAQRSPGSSTGPGFEVEYAFNRWLRANARGGSLPPRLFLRGRYAY